MTVSTIDSKITYNGNGVTTAFSFPYRFLANVDLVVVLVTAAGAEVTKALSTDYSVTGAGDDAGGTLTMIVAPASGERLVIRREIAITQETDYITGDPFPAETHETALDRLTMIAQQQNEVLSRALVFAVSDTGSGQLPNVTDRANRLLGFNSLGEPIGTIPAPGDASALALDLAESDGASLVGFIQTGTGAAVRTMLAKAREVFSPEDFGCVGDGVTNDSVNLQEAVTAAAGKRLHLTGAYMITAAITLPSNIEIVFSKGSKILTATTNINLFVASSKTKIRIVNGIFEQTAAGASAYVAGVHLDNCTDCEVVDNEFIGMQWCGVYLNSSNYCLVHHNEFRNFLGSVADAADVNVYYNSSYNIVSWNKCYGGRSFGVNVQDPGGLGTYLPQRNKIIHNHVGAHTFFGINVYIGGTGPSYNSVIDNLVENISGSENAASGNGIYCVGSGVGGLVVAENNVRNCCTATLNRTNTPAGIGISGTAAGSLGVVVANNIIDGMVQGDGIGIASCLSATTVTGNIVRMPVTNNGTGAGGATMVGNALRLINSDNVSVNGGEYHNNGTVDAIIIYAVSQDMNNNKLVGVGAKSVEGVPIRVTRVAAYVHTGLTIVGNTGQTANNAPYGMELSGVSEGLTSDNRISTGTQVGLYVAATINTRIANNSFSSTGTAGVFTTGVCTGSYYDKTNRHSGFVTNGATGLMVEQLGTAAPGTGTGAVGDRVEARSPAVGNPKGWRCTVAASPGTWVSEGNL